MSDVQEASHESISSTVLTRNAKGGTQITVKVYNEDPEVAAAKAKEIYKGLCKEYAHEG